MIYSHRNSQERVRDPHDPLEFAGGGVRLVPERQVLQGAEDVRRPDPHRSLQARGRPHRVL